MSSLRKGEAVSGLLIGLAVAGLVILNRPSERAEGAGHEPGGGFVSAASYCPFPSEEDATALVSTANVGGRPVHVRASGNADAGVLGSRELDLAPRRMAAIPAGDLGGRVAAIVESFGQRSVTHGLVTVPGVGAASARCAEQPWTRWLFASASTARGEKVTLLLLNAFEEEATIRVRILAPDGDTVPARLRDVHVPQRSQLEVPLADFYPESASFGVEVVATRGRVVVTRYLRASTREGLRGLDLDLGELAPSTRWGMAGGEVQPGGAEILLLANPGEVEALVRIIVHTEAEQLTPGPLQELPVPAGKQVAVNLAEHVPPGARHGVSVQGVNGVPVVVERRQILTSGARVLENAFGSAVSGRRWAASVGSPSGGTSILAVLNDGQAATTASVTLITEGTEAKPPELTALRLEPGRRTTIDLTPFLGGKPAVAVIEAGGSVVVEHETRVGEPFRDVIAVPARLID